MLLNRLGKSLVRLGLRPFENNVVKHQPGTITGQPTQQLGVEIPSMILLKLRPCLLIQGDGRSVRRNLGDRKRSEAGES